MAGLLLAMVVSALLNGDSIMGPNYIDVFFKIVVLYFLLSRLADTPRRVTTAAFGIIAVTAYLAYLAWQKTRTGEVVYARPYYFSSFHDFGLQVVLTLPLVGAMLARRLWLPVRLGLLAMIPMFIVAGMRTQSRSTYLGIGLGLLLLAWYHRRRWYYFLLGIPVVVYAIVHNPQAVMVRLESIWTHKIGEVEDGSIAGRFEQMRTAARVIAANPLFGIGPRQFFHRYVDWVSQEDYTGGSYTMHNVPLLILCEEGAVGFLFYGFLVFGTLFQAATAARRARGDPTAEPIAVAAAGAMMGFLGWIACSLGQPSLYVINIYLSAALVVAARRVVEDRVAEAEAEAESEPGRLAPGPATDIVFS
jgi:hypothetical protein